jgi:hypothetical protein
MIPRHMERNCKLETGYWSGTSAKEVVLVSCVHIGKTEFIIVISSYLLFNVMFKLIINCWHTGEESILHRLQWCLVGIKRTTKMTRIAMSSSNGWVDDHVIQVWYTDLIHHAIQALHHIMLEVRWHPPTNRKEYKWTHTDWWHPERGWRIKSLCGLLGAEPHDIVIITQCHSLDIQG